MFLLEIKVPFPEVPQQMISHDLLANTALHARVDIRHQSMAWLHQIGSVPSLLTSLTCAKVGCPTYAKQGANSLNGLLIDRRITGVEID